MRSMGPPIPRLRPEVEQVARAAGPNKTSQMQTPALNVPAQPPCMIMIVRRSRLPSNQDVVTTLLHVFCAPARGVRQGQQQGGDRRREQLSNAKREFRRLILRPAPDLG